jgi:hexulose-6-phosphate isomerase
MKKRTRQINYWTIGGFEGTTPFAKAFALAKEMGYDGVELAFGTGALGPGITEERCAEIRKQAEAQGVKLETLATGAYWGQSLSDGRAEVRKRAIAFTKEYIQVARWLGAGTVLVVPGAVATPWDARAPVTPYGEAWRHATRSVRACIATAERLKVTIALENVWNWFLADPVAMRTFVDQFESRRLGVYFDVGNCVINGYPEHWIAMLGRRIKAVHFKNFRREDCGGGLHGFGDDLLAGDVNWKKVVEALDKIGYRGPITAEMLPFSRLPNLGLPDMKMARKTAEAMKKILKNG